MNVTAAASDCDNPSRSERGDKAHGADPHHEDLGHASLPRQ